MSESKQSEGARATQEHWKNNPWPQFAHGTIVKAKTTGKIYAVIGSERSAYCTPAMNPDWINLRRVEDGLTFYHSTNPEDLEVV